MPFLFIFKYFNIPIHSIDGIENHLTDNLLFVYIAETLD